MEPHALLTPAERAAWQTCPVDRYGEQGVASFRAHLWSVGESRRADDNLPSIPHADADCDGDEVP